MRAEEMLVQRLELEPPLLTGSIAPNPGPPAGVGGKAPP